MDPIYVPFIQGHINEEKHWFPSHKSFISLKVRVTHYSNSSLPALEPGAHLYYIVRRTPAVHFNLTVTIMWIKVFSHILTAN